MFFTGAIIGCFFFGWMSDNLGRYPTLLATNVILGIGGICLPLCEDTYCFTGVRFVMGLTFNTFFVVMQVLGGLDIFMKWSLKELFIHLKIVSALEIS